VGAKLRNDSRVARVVFVSKAQALAEFRQNSPQLYKALQAVHLRKNPLPDSFAVVPVALSDLVPIHRSIARDRWPGVATLKLVPCRGPRT
jgi:cell division protein FtsX